MTKKKVQKASMVGSAHILKLAKTFEFLSFFEGLGSQVELKMEALRAQGSKLGLIRRLLGDILGFILHSNFEDDFWSAKRSARCGPGRLRSV